MRCPTPISRLIRPGMPPATGRGQGLGAPAFDKRSALEAGLPVAPSDGAPCSELWLESSF